MIKVEKDLKVVPASLDGKSTNQRRDEIIAAGEYPNENSIKTNAAFTLKNLGSYNERYKDRDIRIRLKSIYYKKCAYCEQEVERYDIEHYRPKSIYYWLAYSWDNIFYCCPKCNTNKWKKFDVVKKVEIDTFPINDIHNLGAIYDEYEKPSFVNPEKEDVYKYLIFKKDGSVKSNEPRVKYTIEEIEIDRDDLNESRLNIYNSFKDKVIRWCRRIRNGEKSAVDKLDVLIEEFEIDSENPVKRYISFRRYIVENWIADLVKEELTTKI